MQTIIFFDIDSTLIENRFSGKAIRQLLEEIAPVAEKSVQALGRELGEENSRRQADDPDNVLTMDWHDIVETIAKKYGATLSDDVDTLWNKYAHADDVEILDDAHTMLSKLKDGRHLVIATKGLSKYQNPVLDVTGLSDYFDDVLTPDITGFLKTTREYFNKYFEQDALFIQVGDHYYDDVMCAKRNGFYSVLRAPIDALSVYDPFDRPKVLTQYKEQVKTFPEAGTDVRPDAVVVSLQEVPDVVKRIEAMHKDG